jgi:uncharacterized protein YggE
MRSLLLGILLATVESLAFGQLDSDTLTVSASRSFSLQPDQAVFVISVTAPSSSGLDQVVAGLKTVGIVAANFSGVFSIPDQGTLSWSFTLAVPFSKISSTATQLTANKIAFTVQSSISAGVQQSQPCPLADLMADAKAQAKKLADAAELVVGDVLTLSNGNQSTATSFVYVPTAAFRLGTIPSVAPFIPIQPAVRATCSLTVKFKLLRYHY